MKLIKGLIIVLVSVSLLQGAEKKVDPVLAAWKKQVKEAKASINSITAKELMSWNKTQKKFVLVDVREPDEVLSGWIDADMIKKVPRGRLDPLVAKNSILKPEQTIVTYCKKGGRGALSAKTLKDLGFKNVYNLKGGIEGWIKAGMPIDNELGTFKVVK